VTVIAEEEVLSETRHELGRGGQGVVYSVSGLRIPSLRFSLVYKQFRVPGPVGGLQQLVAKRETQVPHVRQDLDDLTVWPLRIVERDGLATGVLMRLIPSAFTHSVMSPTRRQITQIPRDAQFLMLPDARSATLHIPPATEVERIAICAEFSRAIALLHRIGVVAGDINSRNALYSLDGAPRVLLIDCDAYRLVGTVSSRSLLQTPDWEVPERTTLSTMTDRYKLGLFILRVLTPDDRRSTTRDPEPARETLGLHGMRLLRAALSTTPADRPSAQEWVDHLTTMLHRARATQPKSTDRREL
jgi:DNA-binding helix-hairpin-helix protein with protein kinase domain